ncbi:hypothetical protein CathTA2_0774 [Caldalkalibacillus thermarum TA2.A1]|uniref:Uncharacterized protein n=1 Tax=Caldalkalibacillus thermarum (strain TA2.A1) TaxID=986075 RepID=F5L4R1_CALTT|nr:hypothetical protein [Caldalkalibacillus thermarum]EGL83660.1 hypothetical protein CathTA2_0774 [Caldalkalibacillus thermarum TA2.A1]QZT34710.1 hypothetical protein HUR95_05230 [Caldalkalibacillus thermarum TA2.A1]
MASENNVLHAIGKEIVSQNKDMVRVAKHMQQVRAELSRQVRAELSRSVKPIVHVITGFVRQFQQFKAPMINIINRHLAVTFDSIRPYMEEILNGLPFLVCQLAKDALNDNDKETVNFFLKRYVGIATPRNVDYLALWTVLNQPAWRRSNNPIGYVAVATRREAKRKFIEIVKEDRKLWQPPKDEKGEPKFDILELDKPVSEDSRETVADTIACFDNRIQSVGDEEYLQSICKLLKSATDRKAIMLMHHGYSFQDAFSLAYVNARQRETAKQRVRRTLRNNYKVLLD